VARRGLRERLLYFALLPAIVGAVLVLGAIALRTTLQIEKARQGTVFDATLTLADERVDRLDKRIIAQDNVVAAHVDLASLTTIARRWLTTAGRETPTVRAILVLDMDHTDHDVLAFASRRAGPEDDTFRRLLLTRLFPQMNFAGNTEELRHLHHVIEQQSYLLSYWQRSYLDRHYLVVAWHDVPPSLGSLLVRTLGFLLAFLIAVAVPFARHLAVPLQTVGLIVAMWPVASAVGSFAAPWLVRKVARTLFVPAGGSRPAPKTTFGTPSPSTSSW